MSVSLDAAMRDQADPDVLDGLYGLDALTCQAKRVAENLFVLGGGRPLLDVDRQVTSLSDVVHAALGRVAGWQRVTVGGVADIAVAEHVSGDLIRVVTELLDNAVRYSPRTAPVTASGHLLYDGGVLLRVEDTGIGITDADLVRHNAALHGAFHGADVSGSTAAGHGSIPWGLQVVRQAARTHGIRVSLTGRSPQGTTALVYVPAGLLCELPTEDHTTGLGTANDQRPHGFDRGWSTTTAVPPPTPVSFAGQERSANPAGAGGSRLTPLPIRVPQRLRDMHPEPAVPASGAHLGSNADLGDAVDEIVAFDAATGGAGPIREDLQ
ncbi:hypothetical protein GCM10010399_25790 [Dactylosporangium fulvum]|uniref:histidine kinase n=1 Tax=Dactylosporangium fulvum TaxID=53359 RepID=A0ABY5WC72_9ACTN|nr:ATP-binding protein [Dactylosporangium fulvum]UWP86940.1 ATP-binding protein [Dactylosporangium fulvum]